MGFSTYLVCLSRIGGAPHNWTHIKTFRDEIIGLSEVPALLKKYNLISEDAL